VSVLRGCGVRRQAGIYAECPTSPDGRPIEDFLVDPPQPIQAAALGVTPRGVKLVEVFGACQVIDWVGAEYYPNVADYVEEVRRLGASRRLAGNLDFSRLTARSRLVLVHQRAFIENFDEYYRATGWACPKERDAHSPVNGGRLNAVPARMCAGLWWQDVVPQAGDDYDSDPGRRVRRHMPSFSYEAYTYPDGVIPRRSVAVFMRLPISRLVVVRSDDGSHEAALEAAGKSAIDVSLEDE
jgi:hypothetical protein